MSVKLFKDYVCRIRIFLNLNTTKNDEAKFQKC